MTRVRYSEGVFLRGDTGDSLPAWGHWGQPIIVHVCLVHSDDGMGTREPK